MSDDKPGLLLGKNVPVADKYSPELLYPIPRARARSSLGLGATLPFDGVDLWHAYELCWLNDRGKPVVRVGRFFIPADSPCMVESKSFKLYLNSLNGSTFACEQQLRETLRTDLAAVIGADIELELFAVDAPELDGGVPEGDCLDDLDISVDDSAPGAELLQVGEEVVAEALYSHLLRSLCPVTGQPDWATVYLSYRGRALERESLLRYLIAFRQHQEFHEQCVERMFVDLQGLIEPEFLEIQAFYTRRGGLDINPFRSTDPGAVPLSRMNRQ
ncbi:NADPH-dependent 7-cyano-7-deazaguanine reductase QueF [Seongchinamella sediminis]|uniref:NADPH-dependent 7-cyano-7-deazaguanine reductase n=1 Tax=Seongchinamella sediminis TaxID=2283635 RepID=A0A3L7DWP3_9GAMM|nr:NADPH-dependent 7-cyano-7-deazaguanine reductase QueF [Seongchinamella sediminis]RLQ20212.1 NADPH-dependent 7-cyano-7-deazaguanine reductase QueF [Seongchinamella sediminis]